MIPYSWTYILIKLYSIYNLFQVLFHPDIYVTVIAWSPFLTPGAQTVNKMNMMIMMDDKMTTLRVQVLHQGWLLTPANLESFLSTVISGIQRLDEHISRIAACVIHELGEL